MIAEAPPQIEYRGETVDVALLEEFFAKGRRSVIFDPESGVLIRVSPRPHFRIGDDLFNAGSSNNGDSWGPIPKINQEVTPEIVERYLNRELGFYSSTGTFVALQKLVLFL